MGTWSSTDPPASSLTYTLTLTNVGHGPASSGATLVDATPLGTTASTSTAGCSIISPDWLGGWATGTTYLVNDAVVYLGRTWLAIAGKHGGSQPPNVGLAPDLNPDSWALIANATIEQDVLKCVTPSALAAPVGATPGGSFVAQVTLNIAPDYVRNAAGYGIADASKLKNQATVTLDVDENLGNNTSDANTANNGNTGVNGSWICNTDPNAAWTTLNCDPESDNVYVAADLVVTKTDSANPVSAGNGYVYTITIANSGPSGASTTTARARTSRRSRRPPTRSASR